MQVDLIESMDDRVRFVLRDVLPAFANALRRAALSEVPILAIDEIALYENTSVLFDEQLGLRVGLVPLTAQDLDIYARPEECQCGGEGCPSCRVTFMLTAEGPRTVYSRDLIFNDPTVKVAFDTIPLAILGEGEKLVIEGFATKRTGRIHAKWNAGTQCGYKNLPRIEISGCQKCGKCVEVCPRNILVLGDKDQVEVTDILECSLCGLCEAECEAKAIKVTPIKDAFVFNIDSSGAMPAREMVARGAEEIRLRAEDLVAKLSELS